MDKTLGFLWRVSKQPIDVFLILWIISDFLAWLLIQDLLRRLLFQNSRGRDLWFLNTDLNLLNVIQALCFLTLFSNLGRIIDLWVDGSRWWLYNNLFKLVLFGCCIIQFLLRCQEFRSELVDLILHLSPRLTMMSCLILLLFELSRLLSIRLESFIHLRLRLWVRIFKGGHWTDTHCLRILKVYHHFLVLWIKVGTHTVLCSQTRILLLILHSNSLDHRILILDSLWLNVVCVRCLALFIAEIPI